MARKQLRWPNVERQVVAWLIAQTGRPVFTETPETLAAHLPAYQIERIGGSDEFEIGKAIQVEVNSLAATRPAMWDAVADVETAMALLASNGTEDWYVDDVSETFSAAVAPHPNDGVRRATATYSLTIRPTAT